MAMNSIQQSTGGCIIPAAAIVHSASATVLNNSTSNNAGGNCIDTAGFKGILRIRIHLGAASGICTAFKLQESATNTMGSPADIVGTVYGATGLPALPNASSSNTTHEFYINYRNTNRLRYVAPVVTVDGTGSGDYVSADYDCLEEAVLPFDDTSRGVTDHVSV